MSTNSTTIDQSTTNNKTNNKANYQQPESGDVVSDTPTQDGPASAGTGAGSGVPPTKQTAVAAIGDSLIETMPEVQPHAVAQAADEADKISKQWADIVDGAGNPYDPQIHQSNPDGSPKISPKGRAMRKRGSGRAVGGGQRAAPKQSVIGGVAGRAADAASPTSAETQCRVAGVAAANALIALGVGLGGEEWSPTVNKDTGTDDRAMLESAFGDYFVAKGMTDIPPGVALTIAISCYALPRFTMPKTQSRLSKIKNKIGLWWVNRGQKKSKKHGKNSDKNTDSADHKDDK